MSSPRSADNRIRAESFGADAAAYDRFRPSYPDRLITDLMATNPRTALDVGCGTGKVARLLAGRGVEVLGIEIDDRMADIARGHGITVETGAFETWPDQGRRFDLVVCGQAWHWVDPAAGPPKAAQVLAPSGLLALFWNYTELDGPTAAAMDAAYTGTGVAEQSVVRGGGPDNLSRDVASLHDSGLFSPVQQRSYDWELTYSREQWLSLIATHSDHSTLPAAERANVEQRVGDAINSVGGIVRARYRTYLLLAEPLATDSR
jgi:SAM-dependent methyltransferase